VPGLSRNWRVILLRGFLAVAFVSLALTESNVSVGWLLFFFSLFALGDGAASVWGAFREHRGRAALFLTGVAGLGIWVLAYLAPDRTTIWLVGYVLLWAVATNALEFAVPRTPRPVGGRWTLGAAGAVCLAAGSLLLRAGATRPVVWFLASAAMALGVVLLAAALHSGHTLDARARGATDRAS
jgi:uncharacterized membrane protein HdeD (DUF308 family)